MKARILLLITSFVWGTTFVFQRMSTGTMGAFSFIGVRFLIGALSILPLVYYTWRKLRAESLQSGKGAASGSGTAPADGGSAAGSVAEKGEKPVSLVLCSFILGACLFCGSALQQHGLAYTTAGKSSFISSLYIIAVPILGLFIHNAFRITHLIGCFISLCGLYLLAFHADGGPLNYGDLLNLAGVVFWALQILSIDNFVRWHPGIYLAEGQFIVCSLLGFLLLPFSTEVLTWQVIQDTMIPLLYAGLMSSGVGFTLQIIAQRNVPATEASLLLSTEMIFGAVAGFFILGELMSVREIIGCVLMASGIFLAQIPGRIIWPPEHIRR